MGGGSIVVGLALAIFVGAYLYKPFRQVVVGSAPDWVIETWVSQIRGRSGRADLEGFAAELHGDVEYCTKCGRRAEPDDLFCAQCGTQLREVGHEIA